MMPTTPPDGQGQGERGFGGTTDDDGNAPDDGGSATGGPTPTPPSPSAAPTVPSAAPTSASAAPTFGTDGDRGVIIPTPSPTDHDEDLWDWWHQEGTPRGDRGQALATGVGEYADRRFLVGTEDGVLAIDDPPSASSGEKRTKKRPVFHVILLCDR